MTALSAVPCSAAAARRLVVFAIGTGTLMYQAGPDPAGLVVSAALY